MASFTFICKTQTLIIFILLTYTHTPTIQAFKSPIHPQDILPLLPRQVSWPILNSLRGAADLLPSFVGAAAIANNSVLQWKGSCFFDNTAWLELHNKSGSEFGGGTLHIKVSNAHSWTCMDIYLFATPYRVTWDYYFLSREHTLEFEEWSGKAEYEYVKRKGVAIFLMEAGMLGTLEALWEVFPLFTNTGWGENSNIAFLKKHMGATFEARPEPWVTNITQDDIHSGDFLALSKIRGRWGGFETLEKWVSGAYVGHSAVCLRDPQGKLWVGESGHEDEEGQDVIALLPWDEWWDFELNKDDANPHIALLPLHPDLRSSFNETAAWEYAQSMVGLPYGYHNLIFSWIDTVSDNYPPPLDANLVASVMTVWDQMQPAYAANMWNEALNKRLGTRVRKYVSLASFGPKVKRNAPDEVIWTLESGRPLYANELELPEILVEVERRGSSFAELLTIPEQDDWVYADGKSTSCVAFILEIYKEAGLFGELADQIQVTEFTIKDAYTLNFYENNSTRLPKWCNEDDTVDLPFCQIKGKYRMELPGYNTIDPYPYMTENCPSLPPEYSRPQYC